jgi:diacylglycerol kinase family enzyme
MISGDLPYHHPELWAGRCEKVLVESDAPLAAHLDGELFSRPEDRIHRIEMSIRKHALRVRTGTPAR